MRLVAVLGAICALTQAVSAESGDCTSITDSAGQLACFNREPPPTTRRPAPATRPAAAAKPTAPATDSTKYTDTISNEDAIVSAKMRGICRGC
jgi:hypothetical protein